MIIVLYRVALQKFYRFDLLLLYDGVPGEVAACRNSAGRFRAGSGRPESSVTQGGQPEGLALISKGPSGVLSDPWTFPPNIDPPGARGRAISHGVPRSMAAAELN